MIKLDLRPKKELVVLQSEKGEQEYYISEMTAEERDDYLQALSSRVKVDEEGRPQGLKDFRGIQAELLSRCLRTKKGELVKKEEIQSWPSSVVTSLYEIAQKINLLSEGEGEKILGKI